MEGANLVYIAAGLGGGTGTGAAPVIAELALPEGHTDVAGVTMPFAFEGGRAETGLKKATHADGSGGHHRDHPQHKLLR